ncbi:MAG TPA: hypothetical protein VLF20_02385 [Patescibacteria group bacterium]|nr:hypothetical protein [Patescibacteria group bacterium]
MKNNNQKLHGILLEILQKKQEDLSLQKEHFDAHEFHEMKKTNKENRFRKLFHNRQNMILIGEIKFSSPTHPQLGKKSELLERVEEYEKNGINAMSIITEKHFFNGDISFIKKVKKRVKLPILQKDFFIDANQIYESKKEGADALLLIARLLNHETLSLFVNLCQALGIEPVVEIANLDDLHKAVKTKTNIIAVNARDLETFVVDVEKACVLIRKIPDNFIKLGFSGIVSNHECVLYKRAGADGILVGTNLMKAKNVAEFISDIRHVQTKVKICGVRTFEDAKIVIAAGADFLGFNFVPTSKRYIDPQKVKKIINDLRRMNDAVRTKFVGVFQNQSVDEVNHIAEMLQLDFVQLHGNEDIPYREKIKMPIIQKIYTDGSYRDRSKSDYLLLDREVQGKGMMIDITIAKEIARFFPVFIAGGLTQKNVSTVVREVMPFAVDVAGGIETDGKQDEKKIRQFIKKVKEVIL